MKAGKTTSPRKEKNFVARKNLQARNPLIRTGQSTPNLGGHKESRPSEVKMTAIQPPRRSWATHKSENLQACSVSSHASFFACERLCDVDPCCTGFGFLNVSQLKGNKNSLSPACTLQSRNTFVFMILSSLQHCLTVGGE